MTAAAAAREAVLDRFHGGTYDLLVIGGGIVGTRIALDAANAGLRVALVDRGDFGGATSGASTKLVHGGLRYLARGRVGLVRAAQRERHALEHAVAPGLVWSIPFVLARTGGGASRVLLPIATTLYRGLARDTTPPRRLSVADVRGLVPTLDPTTVDAAVLLREGQTNDARLTLATARAAAEAGADVANYVRAVSLERARGRMAAAILEGLAGEGLVTLRTRAVVNATGPWIDQVRLLEDPGAAPAVRLSRGVNVTLALDEPWGAALALFDTRRSIVAAPWHGVLVVGATDTSYDGEPGDEVATAEDVRSLLEPLAGVVSSDVFRPERVLCAFSGLRALALGKGATTSASRDHVLAVGPYGVVSVAGGKLTTHRVIARSALAALPPDVRPRGLRRADAPLTPWPTAAAARLHDTVDRELLAYLVQLYGGRAAEVLADGADAAPIAPGGPDVWSQARYARDAEWALSVDDVVRRRTTLELRGLATPAVRQALADALGLSQHAAAQTAPAPV